MEDNGVMPLEAVSEIQEEHEPFQNTEDIDIWNDCIDESSDFSDADVFDDDDDDDEYFHSDEVTENSHDANDNHAPIEESSMPLTQPSPHAPLSRKNVENTLTRKLKHVEPSMSNATTEHDKIKTDILNKSKDKLRELASSFKDMCPSAIEDWKVSNMSPLTIEIFNTLVNTTFIQHLKSNINRSHSGDDKLKGHDMSQCFRILTALQFYQVSPSLFLVIIMGIHSLKKLNRALNHGHALRMDLRMMLVAFAKMKFGM